MKKVLVLLIASFFILSCGKKVKKTDLKELKSFVLVQKFDYDRLYRYIVEKSKADSESPELEKIIGVTEITLQSHDTRKESKFIWRYGETTAKGFPMDSISTENRKMMNLSQDLALDLVLDSVGNLVEFLNFDSCVTFMKRQYKVVDEFSAKHNGGQRANMDQMMKFIEPTMATEEIFINTYCPELMLLMACNGKEFFVDSIIIEKSFLPNPFGGEDIPSMQTTKTVLEGDEFATFAKITISQQINEADMKRIMEEMMNKMSENGSQDFNMSQLPTMDVRTNVTYTYDLNRKLIRNIESEKIIKVEFSGKKREEKQIMNIFMGT